MKKLLCFLFTLLTVLGALAFVSAEALNITQECTFKVSYTEFKYTLMTDNKYTTHWRSKKDRHPNVAITAPAGMDIHGLYICFATIPPEYEIQVEENGKWVKYCDGPTDFLHTYIDIPEGTNKVRLYVTYDKSFQLDINELFVLSEGSLPEWVQLWEPTPEKSDILFFSTHPDDELLFFCGALPIYAAEQGREVAVAYLVPSNTTRTSEALNGLYTLGIRNYPIFCDIRDKYASSMSTAYKNAGGEAAVLKEVVSVIRQTKPEVIVTQDEKGEYGHGQHQMLSDAVRKAYDLAGKETANAESLGYGIWQPKKLYLHLWKENRIAFDWQQPLEAFGGRTALNAVQEAYALHVTQASAGFKLNEKGVTYKGKTYDNVTYGLVKTEVGEDVRKDDFLENIYDAPGSFEAAPATPAPTPVVTPAPEWHSILPETNEKGFLDEGEFVIADETNGHYVYIDDTVKIIIERKYEESDDKKTNLTWFEAEIWSDVDAGEYLKTLFYDENKKGAKRVDAAKNATEHKSVFAMNTDYYTYRVSSNNGRRTGVVVRNGKVLYDDGYKKENTYFPNLDMVAFFPDGRLEVYHSYEFTGKQLVEMGAENVYSFGPYLIRDGKLSDAVFSNSSVENKNPRCAIGMVEPGHYVAIMAEGRLDRSGGITMNHLALLMKKKNCETAINLDGGQTAVMCFMGKQINRIGKYDGGKTNARETCDILTIGTSEQVGNVEWQ